MRRRILAAILSVTAVSIILFALPLAIVVRQLVDEDAALRVEREAVLAVREVPPDFADSQDPVELPENNDGITLGLYSSEGRLVSGSGPQEIEPSVRPALGNRIVDAEVSGSRLAAVPVAANEQVIGLIRAEQSTSASDRRSRNLLALLGGVALVVVAIGAVIGAVLAGRLARPVRRLRDAAVELGHGNFAVGVPISKVPELDQAGEALISTGRRLEDLVSRERSFSHDASHQLRTPVTGLRAAIETELRFPREDPQLVLHEALEDVDRLEATITELLSIARAPHIINATFAPGDVLAEVLPRWRSRLADEGRSLSLRGARHVPPVHGNSALLRHVLDVLLDNALRHGAGTVQVLVSQHPDVVKVAVSDEGPGFTTASGSPQPTSPTDRVSTHGLGLPLARRYVEAMGGKLILPSRDASPQVEVVLRRERD
ncbi:MAG: Histidine kinase [Nocardioides sp.]|nr:Histidine kinase [Nocardioides sp.]